MRTFDGWHFPDHERHLIAWMQQMKQRRHGRAAYQLTKYLKAMEFVTERRRAVDIGAHVGLWTYQMAHDFAAVDAFEPMPGHIECWRANIDAATATLHEVALGEADGSVRIRTETPDSSGDTCVDPLRKDGVEVPIRRLDDFGLENVDFLKADNEGYEIFALRGGEDTIRRCRPVVIVEQKPGKAQKYGLGETDAVKLLQSWGAEIRGVMAGDYILAW